MSLIINFVPVFTVFASLRNAFFSAGKSQGNSASSLQSLVDQWLGFLVFTQAAQVRFLGRELRSHSKPPLTAVSPRSFPPSRLHLRICASPSSVATQHRACPLMPSAALLAQAHAASCLRCSSLHSAGPADFCQGTGHMYLLSKASSDHPSEVSLHRQAPLPVPLLHSMYTL